MSLRRAVAGAVAALTVAGCGAVAPLPPAAVVQQRPGPPAVRVPAEPTYAVGERVVTFIDHRRTIRSPGHRPRPRALVTVIRYPAVGAPSAVDLRGAAPDRATGPFPLIVFGHGYAVTPAYYFRLLRAWARAGYVVAAPVFPLGNQHAPGGPDEADIVNQPRDMSVVISRLLGPRSPLRGLIAAREVAVAGQSDGGETALAVAYDRAYRDRRVRAAVILSGAQIPGAGTLVTGPGAPPLLATQGTADTINRPQHTYAFFAAARRPKFLLSLIGAPHLPPYTSEEPQLRIVERVTLGFLDRYLKDERSGLARMRIAAHRAGIAALTADP